MKADKGKKFAKGGTAHGPRTPRPDGGEEARMRAPGLQRPQVMPPANGPSRGGPGFLYRGLPARPAGAPSPEVMRSGALANPGARMAPPVAPPALPVRPAFRKGGSVDGVAKKGKTSTKMVKMAKGGSFRSSANGIASRGKTRGKMC